MTTNDPTDLIRVVADLGHAFMSFNIAIRREVERRAGHQLLSNEEVHVLNYLFSHPDSRVAAIAEATGLPRVAVQQSARKMQLLGLLMTTPNDQRVRDIHLRATRAAVSLRIAATERSTQQVRYAIAGISAQHRADLTRATAALAALSVALGHQGLHSSYDEPGDPIPPDQG